MTRPEPDFSGAAWRISSHSTDNGGTCVEVAVVPGWVGVRDSKDRGGPVLALPGKAWTAFLRGVRDGQFDGGR